MMNPEEKNSKLQPTRIINAEKSDDDENDTSEVNIHDTPSNSSSGSPIIDTNEHNFVNVNVEHENGLEIESNSPLKSSGISNSSKSNSLSKLLNNSSSNSSSFCCSSQRRMSGQAELSGMAANTTTNQA